MTVSMRINISSLTCLLDPVSLVAANRECVCVRIQHQNKSNALGLQVRFYAAASFLKELLYHGGVKRD